MPKLRLNFSAHRIRFCGLKLLVILLVLGGSAAYAGEFDHSHRAFTQILSEIVQDGRVNYRRLQADTSALDAYLTQLASPVRADFQKWQREQQVAYWLNAYNASVLKAIVEAYPLKRRGFKGLVFPANSIWQIPGVWKKLKRPLLDAEPYSLDQIEHDILRPQYNEPRIHFAVVCASISCPPLRPEAYRASVLDEQLRDQTASFLADNQHGVTLAVNQLRVSRIFKWFGKDFAQFAPKQCRSGQQKAGVAAFVAHYLGSTVLEQYCAGSIKLKYLDYDWRLNDASTGS